MDNIRDNIPNIESEIMSGLKRFQQATVNYIDELYRDGQKRILVSDEVGLGKTLIARGMIAKLAKLNIEEGNDKLFKVIYICSNAAIAGQNLNKLRIGGARAERTGSSRLSMQHLNIFMQDHDPVLLRNFVQLIPLTPDTSFRMTSGTGIYEERALMYAILRRLPELKKYRRALEVTMTDYAFDSWERVKNQYEGLVVECNYRTKRKYLEKMLAEVSAKLLVKRDSTCGDDDKDLLTELIEHCAETAKKKYKLQNGSYIVAKLRVMFAEISIDLLKPDFIIMDEFQRFKYLLDSVYDTETGMLAQRFFNNCDVRMLLLSATPFKMYSTLDEIDEYRVDEHYYEFFKVIDFLNPDETEKQQFKEIWSDYSVKLRAYSKGNISIFEAKRNAEESLSSIICRTERVSARECADMIKYLDKEPTEKSATDVLTTGNLPADNLPTDNLPAGNLPAGNLPVRPTDADIKSFLEIQGLIDRIEARCYVPVDYVKSSPYLLSFMRDYQLKKIVEEYFKKHPDELPVANRSLLWLKHSQLRDFRKIDPANARLQYVQNLAFEKQAERLLWVPPSLPYYELSGAFKGSERFSKMLVFSSWEMVPRMLAALISYESERKNAQILAARSSDDAREARYFSSDAGKKDAVKKRYPPARLNFSVSADGPRGLPLFCFLYPAMKLSGCFDPVDVLNRRLSLKELEKEVRTRIGELLSELKCYEGGPRREDDRWYYLAPMLMDSINYVREWLSRGVSLAGYADLEGGEGAGATKRGQLGFTRHLEELKSVFADIGNLKLGKQPGDLLTVLTNMALASPAICAMRAYFSIGSAGGAGDAGSAGYSVDMPSQLAKVFINRMNTPESTAVIEAFYLTHKKRDEDSHWRNLLAYCKDGNLQAVFDEYVHMLVESNGLMSAERRIVELHRLMLNSLNIHTASYRIDTFNSLRDRLSGKEKPETMNIRSHFAAAFTKSDGGVKKDGDRKESVRNSFNSPFRPFVLATTSIGQEGLDFHYYCRRIVHWNLPSNPIDIEQREGRINRYKCLAIRQNIALRYRETNFGRDIWRSLFDEAAVREEAVHDSELIPYWGVTDSEDMVKIERIVPMYPFSRDVSAYTRLIKILSLYRLTLGQARQEELLEHLFSEHKDDKQIEDELRNLFINLSPYYKNLSELAYNSSAPGGERRLRVRETEV